MLKIQLLQDHEVNNRKVIVHCGCGIFETSKWKKLRVGDVVKVEKDKFFPADLLLLTKELGHIDTILVDKTGTSTCNSMEFIKCSVAGSAYGRRVTEVERAMAKRTNSQDHSDDYENDASSHLLICHTALS